MDKPVASITKHWAVAERDVYRWVSDYKQNKLFQKHPSQQFRDVCDEDLDLLLSFFYHHPLSYLAEASAFIFEHTGRSLPIYTISRALTHHHITNKVVELRAIEHNPVLRQIFRYHISQFSVNQLVFVDETPCNPATFRRRYGWSIEGPSAFYSLYHQLHGEGRSLSSIVPFPLSSSGVLSYSVHNDIINADLFSKALVEDILPNMREFPSSNSVLVRDHSRTHDPLTLIEECEKRGIILLFLPQYSYDLYQ